MIGVNLNPDQQCNFDCPYCDVQRGAGTASEIIDVPVLIQELEDLLARVQSGRLRQSAAYRQAPGHLLKLQQVAISGEGEPTLCPQFAKVVEAITHVRAVRGFPFFKLVLITNASALDRPSVQAGLKLFTAHDEVWAKLDAGTQDYMSRINCPTVPLVTVLENIRRLARRRPVVIQTMFVELDGSPPPLAEIREYTNRLRELQEAGAQISQVQIYSASRPPVNPRCRHLPLKTLSEIAQAVRAGTGLQVTVS